MITALVDDLRAYKRARLLATVIRLGLLDALRTETLSCGELVTRCGIRQDYVISLTSFLTHLGLLTLTDHGYALTDDGQQAVADPVLKSFAAYHFHCYDAWELLPNLCCGTLKASRFHRQRSDDPEFCRAYLTAMDSIAEASLPLLLDVCGPMMNGRILDVGAGPSTFCRRIAQLRKGHVTAIDIPNIVRMAKRTFETPDQFEWVEGDFQQYRPDPLYDVVFCSHLLEYCAASELQEWLAQIKEFVNLGGTLVFVVFLRHSDSAHLLALDLFEISTGVNGEQLGHVCTPREFAGALDKAGLSILSCQRIPSGPSYDESLVVCQKVA